MPHSTRWSSASAPCRLPSRAIEARLGWKPSRWLAAALLAMTPLAAFSVLASEMPRVVAWPLAVAALVYGGWLTRREWRRPRREFVFCGDRAPARVDGVPVEDVEMQWRGPLASVRWRDPGGRRHRLAWWPDTLPPARRRELRLAAPSRDAAPGAPSVAT